jgi:prevent-host-death family protein
MKHISLKTLKENLSDYTEAAAKGEVIAVTKYNRPYIVLSPSTHSIASDVHVGKSLGAPLSSIGGKTTKGKNLALLLEDRDNER